jgi:hypothetical protein
MPYQISWEVMGLERGPLSLVSTIEELLERISSCIGLEKPRLRPLRICCADYATHLYPQKLALTSPTSGGHSVGIVRSRAQATVFSFDNNNNNNNNNNVIKSMLRSVETVVSTEYDTIGHGSSGQVTWQLLGTIYDKIEELRRNYFVCIVVHI